MSAIILASITTLLVIVFASAAYVVNDQKMKKLQSSSDTQMADVVDQINKNQYKNFTLDREQQDALVKNRVDIEQLRVHHDSDFKKLSDIFKDHKDAYLKKTSALDATDAKLRTDVDKTTAHVTKLQSDFNKLPIAEQEQYISALQNTTTTHANLIDQNSKNIRANHEFMKDRVASIDSVNRAQNSDINVVRSEVTNLRSTLNNYAGQQAVVTGIQNDVNALKTWRTGTITPWYSAVDSDRTQLKAFKNSTEQWMSGVDVFKNNTVPNVYAKKQYVDDSIKTFYNNGTLGFNTGSTDPAKNAVQIVNGQQVKLFQVANDGQATLGAGTGSIKAQATQLNLYPTTTDAGDGLRLYTKDANNTVGIQSAKNIAFKDMSGNASFVHDITNGATLVSKLCVGKTCADESNFNKGERGPKGDTGAVGPQGPAGPQGPRGQAGDSGFGAQTDTIYRSSDSVARYNPKANGDTEFGAKGGFNFIGGPNNNQQNMYLAADGTLTVRDGSTELQRVATRDWVSASVKPTWDNIQGKPITKTSATVLDTDVGIRLSKGWSGYPDGRTDGSEISNDVTNHKTLMIVGNKSSGTRQVSVWDRLNVNGTLCVSGQCIDGGTLARLIAISGALAKPPIVGMSIGGSSTGNVSQSPQLVYRRWGKIEARFRVRSAFGTSLSEPADMTHYVNHPQMAGPDLYIQFSSPYTGTIVFEKVQWNPFKDWHQIASIEITNQIGYKLPGDYT